MQDPPNTRVRKEITVNSWSVVFREIAVVGTALLPIVVIGALFQLSPSQVEFAFAVVGLLTGITVVLHRNGKIHWKLLEKLIPIK